MLIEKIKDFITEIEQHKAEGKDVAEELRLKFLSKKGIVTEMFKEFRQVPNEQKKELGQLLNKFKGLVEARIAFLRSKAEDLQEEGKNLDLSLSGPNVELGAHHPISAVKNEIIEIFSRLGFTVAEGQEIEDDYHNFTALNFPPEHPARDMQDSFYITDEYLLRTQTSSVQARTLMANKDNPKPVRIIVPGKTYRREDDATHSHQFGQIEGLVIDKKENNVSLADLKGTLEVFVRKVIGKNSELRFRPSYFPFTEPSYEVDVSCFKCGGSGCSLCKNTGWITVSGAGMVHPNVLKMNGYDPDLYGGFAFGTGIDRLAMFKYGITDMRYLYTNDVRFLKQFDRKD